MDYTGRLAQAPSLEITEAIPNICNPTKTVSFEIPARFAGEA